MTSTKLTIMIFATAKAEARVDFIDVMGNGDIMRMIAITGMR